MRLIIHCLFGLAAFCSCSHPPAPITASSAAGLPQPVAGKVNGLTFVAPPEPFADNPMSAVRESGATWIAVVPYAYTRLQEPEVRFNEHRWQWWGERPEGAQATIRLAKEQGIRVMLKPQVYIPGGWTGALDFPNDSAWTAWEAGYSRYILLFAQMAEAEKVDLFCIGTEFNRAIQKRGDYWRQLIVQIKKVYRGKLTYSANWDDWAQVPFWSELDYVGLGGYFPLVEGKTPEVSRLCEAWKPIAERLESFSKTVSKPVLFTEFGYLSVDGCGWQNWELEKGIEQRSINQEAQANCYEALFASLQGRSWWAGGFLWKWFPNMRGHEGYPERDYTPQGKKAEQVLKKWYGAH